MRIGTVGSFGTPAQVVELAVEAERAGWDGWFTWDALAIGEMPGWDPWVVLGAAAARTERVTLGALVFAPARHDPYTLVRQVQSVDHLSGGRLVLPVGIGVGEDVAYGAASRTGAPMGPRERAERLDDALALLTATADGGPADVDGTHLRVDGLALRPGTVQRPHVPVWVVGAWPARRSLERAARWDGWVVQRLRAEDPLSPDELRGALAEVLGLRAEAGAEGPFEVVLSGRLPDDPGAARELLAGYAEAGATWWVDAEWSPDVEHAWHLERVRRGPPRP
jgi:alkanesulfonate monooxygenase SsuD/methylene tetrahydromethanopterin reductase-like flavin-dependent oxidoreductase (luciferase family)